MVQKIFRKVGCTERVAEDSEEQKGYYVLKKCRIDKMEVICFVSPPYVSCVNATIPTQCSVIFLLLFKQY